MSFINPEKVPVKVYRSTDQDAPRLDKTPNCVATIFKACLVTGYGEKEPAGWTMPFEDNDKGIKVFRPQIGVETDFYLRLSNDTGQEMTTQVYLNMTDVDTGDKKLECDTPFRYGYGSSNHTWLLIANGRSFWLWFSIAYNDRELSKTGGYFFCGDTAKNMVGNRAVLLKHTGGLWRDGAGYDVFSTDTGGAVAGLLLDADLQVAKPVIESFFDSKTAKTALPLLAPIYAHANQQYYPVPAIYTCSNGASQNNFDTYQNKIILGLSSYRDMTNFYFDTDVWVY